MGSAKSSRPAQTMEVPKTLNVRITDGILESADDMGSVLQLAFNHLHGSMNDKNSLDKLKGLAEAHGWRVTVTD